MSRGAEIRCGLGAPSDSASISSSSPKRPTGPDSGPRSRPAPPRRAPRSGTRDACVDRCSPRAAAPLVTLSGVTDAGANALLVVAVREGLLSVVAPVANLFPAVTVLLARAFGHEKIGRFRLVGLGLAVAAWS